MSLSHTTRFHPDSKEYQHTGAQAVTALTGIGLLPLVECVRASGDFGSEWNRNVHTNSPISASIVRNC